MKRNPEAAFNQAGYDLAIIGGGIHGLAAAWDAALRGLSVVLVEKGDFGQGASANSYRIVHGGLRYLQHLNFRRMRASILERRWFLKAAPHLVQPMEYLIPCYGHGIKGPEAMKAALLVNDLVSWDRNKGVSPSNQIPCGRVISAEAARRRLPIIQDQGLTGGAVFHDGRMADSERLTFSFAEAASLAGATLLNYVEAVGVIGPENEVRGIKVTDVLSGQHAEIAAKVTLDLSGPWTGITRSFCNGQSSSRTLTLSKGIQLFTRRVHPGDFTFSFPAAQSDQTAVVSRGNRLYFAMPWDNMTFWGTTDSVYEGDPDAFSISEQDIASFLDEINTALPQAKLTLDDVVFANGGLRPLDPATRSASHKTEIVDHAKHGIKGLISLTSVKFTTARRVAERCIDLVFSKLGKPLAQHPGPTFNAHLPGGDLSNPAAEAKILASDTGLDPAEAENLVTLYGSRARKLAAPGQDLLQSQVIHAVDAEMGVTLEDVIVRRTGHCRSGPPGKEALERSASIMAKHLGWSEDERNRQLRSAQFNGRPLYRP